MQRSKILWSESSKDIIFALYTFNDDSDFWKKCSLGLKTLQKASNNQIWKLCEVKFWPKLKMQNSALGKPLNLEI